MIIPDNFKKAINLINSSRSWLVTSHIRPDGDAVGCMKSFCELAAQLGRVAKPLLLSPPAEWYKIVFGTPVPVLGNDVKLDELQSGKFGKFDLVIIVDTNSSVQLVEFDRWLKVSKLPVLIIDHHISGDGLGTVEVIDTTAAATGEIVFDLFRSANWQITPVIAEALFVAISTDTGWFRFDNTDARVMRNASALIELGAKPAEIYHKMYQNYSPERLKLLGKMLESLELHYDNRIALMSIMRRDFELTGATGSETEDFINEAQRIGSVEASALFIELKDGNFRCSLRSNGCIDVCKIAAKFGGGGHKVAAGTNIKGPLDTAKKTILEEFVKALAGK